MTKTSTTARPTKLSQGGKLTPEFNTNARGVKPGRPQSPLQKEFTRAHDGRPGKVADPKAKLVAKPSPRTMQAVHEHHDKLARSRNRNLSQLAKGKRVKLPLTREFNWEAKRGASKEILPKPEAPKLAVSPGLRKNAAAEKKANQKRAAKAVKPQFQKAAGGMTTKQRALQKRRFAERMLKKRQDRRRGGHKR